ncbi:TIGR03085 family metal-binding protein [Kitasatospora sp. NPDC049258]|uniref:TIGR03085 family metal-binding protein n=1 Tax=Kitasatospora sp. NPDC049258 TaxID=3155394 RepID=UPI00342F7142
MATRYARVERERLAGLLAAAGPDAPTRCAGWRTRELAAHLVLRERRPDAAAGIALKALAGWTHRVQSTLAERPYDELVRLFGSGPPRLSLFALPGADEAANVVEFFVHAEDVRRAGAAVDPGPVDPGLAESLWRRLPSLLRFEHGRRLPVGLVLVHPDGRRAELAHRTAPTVEVTGEPGELVLFGYGRGACARITVSGAETAVAALRRVLPLP